LGVGAVGRVGRLSSTTVSVVGNENEGLEHFVQIAVDGSDVTSVESEGCVTGSAEGEAAEESVSSSSVDVVIAVVVGVDMTVDTDGLTVGT